MKKKIIIIVLSVIFLVAVGFGIYFIVQANKPAKQYEKINVEETNDEKEIKKNELTGLPSEHSGSEVALYSIDKVNKKEEFKVTTTGETKALFISQKISNERIVKKDKAMITTLCLGVKNVICQRYYNSSNVFLREGTNENDKISWSMDAPKKYSHEEMLNMYGWEPNKANGYVINNDTFLNKDFSVINNNNNTYSFEFDLNPGSEYGPKYYQREIHTTSGSKEFPQFKKIHIKMTIDKDYNLLSQEIEEEYSVAVMGFNVTSNTKVVDTFSYNNVEFNSEFINYFNKYENA